MPYRKRRVTVPGPASSVRRRNYRLRRKNWIPRGIAGVEKKEIYGHVAHVVDNVTGGAEKVNFYPLSLAQGAGTGERIGRKIMLKSLHCKIAAFGHRQYDVNGGSSPIQVRLVCVLYKNTNGLVTQQWSDVFEHVVGAYTLHDRVALDKVKSFRLLYDEVLTLPVAGISFDSLSVPPTHITNYQMVNRTYSKKFNLPVTYVDGSTVPSDYSIQWMALSNVKNFSTVMLNVRLRYTDM